MISLCMIVKNEEDNLYKCLNSVKDFIDDIIIVDTGSSDNTKNIARNFTQKIYDYEWNNNFSDARNYSISKAKNDWILVLDADEEIIKFDEFRVLEFISNSSICTIGRIKRFNVFDRNVEVKTYIERVNRLFNKNFYKYSAKVHEQLKPIKMKKNIGKMIYVDIEVNHIGYTNEIIKRTNKIQRNIELLKEMLEEEPSDIYLIYQLGKSHYMNESYSKAYEHFTQAIKLLKNEDFNLEYVGDLIESYGYSLINLEKYNEALVIDNYEKYYSNEVDFIFLKALVYMNNGKFKESAELFLKCIDMEEGRIQGINSYLASYNIGVIFECLGFIEEAYEYYRLCGSYNPALKRIEVISK